MKLPASYLKTWNHIRHWREGFKVPNSWHRVRLQARSLGFSSGEKSKDSGRRWLEGDYEVLSGEGSKAAPFVLRVKVRDKGCSQSHGYPESYRVEDEFEARVYLADNRLHFSAPGFGSEDFDPPQASGEAED